MAQITGTFTATGNSQAISGQGGVAIQATFAGTATVNIQWDLGDGFVTIADGSFTSTFSKVVDVPGIAIHLNCSAYTNNVSYTMTGK